MGPKHFSQGILLMFVWHVSIKLSFFFSFFKVAFLFSYEHSYGVFYSKLIISLISCCLGCLFSWNKRYFVMVVVMGVIIPLIGVLFGYTGIFLKVRSVKIQLRQHQEAVFGVGNDLHRPELRTRPRKPGYTQDDIKLAKTLFAAFTVFLVCW